MADTELAREQRYVAGLYRRLDDLKHEALESLERVRATNAGGNHQSRSERDAYARMYENRVAQLNEVTEGLAFGRLELETDAQRSGADPATPRYRYVGRIGMRDDEQNSILLDWRAPQASAFYQATAASPMGARARRNLTSRGRDIVRIDDEIFDSALLADESSTVHGDGALMAALSAQRTGHMHDIVATIQAEQDRIIRSELQGALVVQGGPGTGKTVVALHRAAYLLYTHRARLASSGVLVVGPSRSFLRYIEEVLPSLGETGVVLSTLGTLYPGVEATAVDEPEVVRLKGSAEMADVIRRAVRSRQVVPSSPQTVSIDNERLEIEPLLFARAIDRARESGKPHNDARVVFVEIMLGELTRRLANRLREQGSTVDEADETMLREDLRAAHDVKVALNTAWLPLTPQKLVSDLFARPSWFATLTPRWTPAERALMVRLRHTPFTVDDVPLLDEAAEFLGDYDTLAGAHEREAREQRKRDVENAEQAIRNMDVGSIVSAEDLAAGFAETVYRGTTAERAISDRKWAYGHVVVDEAQELSPMQWRMVARRSPLRSLTIVGDIAQASAVSGATSWAEALQPVLGRVGGERGWRMAELSVNYRTPTQIVEAAETTARCRGLTITPSRPVRETEWPVMTTRADISRGDDAFVAAVVSAVAADRAISTSGTLAVIAPRSRVRAIAAALATLFGDGHVLAGAPHLDRPIGVMAPLDTKGLEFDAVVVVDPEGIVDTEPRGAAALYVAMTRPTQRLHMVKGATGRVTI